MKQRGKRSNSKLVHVSFDEVERFVPRVPKQICPDEDNTTPRICVAPNILSAIQAMPQGGTVAYNMARIGVPVVIHAYYIGQRHCWYVTDALGMEQERAKDAIRTRAQGWYRKFKGGIIKMVRTRVLQRGHYGF